MNEVYFPGFGLEFKFSSIAITLFGIDIYWYSIFIVFAIIIALFIFKKQDGKFGIEFQTILDLSLYLIPISFLSARAYYVMFNPERYLNDPLQIFNFRNGGIAIYGGIIGGVITCIVFCKKRKINLLNLLDYIVPSLALGQAIGRWGNFINVEAYGEATTLPWRMGIFENGLYKEVHPTFLYESIATFAIFFILIQISKKRRYKGQVTYYYLILYSFVRFFIEGLRIDSLMFYNFRISQIVSIILFVVFCSIVLYNERNIAKIVTSGEK